MADIFDIEHIQWLACISSCVLAFILILIKIPQTEYTRKLGSAKNIIAISFFLCGFLMFFTVGKSEQAWNYDLLSMVTMLICVSFSTMAMSYSMISILGNTLIKSQIFVADAFAMSLVSIAMIEGSLGESALLMRVSLALAILLFISQSIYYIVKFDKAYKKTARELSAYYDEDEEHKVKWIRFCYILAMLTDLFFLVYLILPAGALKVYIVWYVIFMIYFSANFISFLGSHKLVLDAFAHSTLSGEDFFPDRAPKAPSHKKEEPVFDRKQLDREFKEIAVKLDQWVSEKHYRQYDKTREEIARDMGTSKEMLQLYFSMVLRQDFRNWRTELRINDAKKMLLEDRESSLQIIGERCGFSDRSNFHTQFVKLVGCSPKRWRETGGHPETLG